VETRTGASATAAVATVATPHLVNITIYTACGGMGQDTGARVFGVPGEGNSHVISAKAHAQSGGAVGPQLELSPPSPFLPPHSISLHTALGEVAKEEQVARREGGDVQEGRAMGMEDIKQKALVVEGGDSLGCLLQKRMMLLDQERGERREVFEVHHERQQQTHAHADIHPHTANRAPQVQTNTERGRERGAYHHKWSCATSSKLAGSPVVASAAILGLNHGLVDHEDLGLCERRREKEGHRSGLERRWGREMRGGGAWMDPCVDISWSTSDASVSRETPRHRDIATQVEGEGVLLHKQSTSRRVGEDGESQRTSERCKDTQIDQDTGRHVASDALHTDLGGGVGYERIVQETGRGTTTRHTKGGTCGDGMQRLCALVRDETVHVSRGTHRQVLAQVSNQTVPARRGDRLFGGGDSIAVDRGGEDGNILSVAAGTGYGVTGSSTLNVRWLGEDVRKQQQQQQQQQQAWKMMSNTLEESFIRAHAAMARAALLPR